MKKAKLGSRQAWFWLTLGLLIVLCVGIGVQRQERADRQARLNRDLVNAVVNDRLETVQSLLREGADPNARQQPDVPAATTWEGIKASLQRLLRRQPQDEQDAPPMALSLAAQGLDNNEIAGAGLVRALMDAGADPDLVSGGGRSPDAPTARILLDWAVTHGELDITKRLLDKGADVRVRGPEGETPLHQAVAGDGTPNLDIVRLLLARGADVNVANDDGETPLMAAVESAPDEDVVNLLLAGGADVTARNKAGETALFRLISSDRFISADLMDKEKVPALLLAAGADVNDTDKDGNTALSASVNRKEAFLWLLAHGAKVFTAKDPQGGNLLMSAYRVTSYSFEPIGDGGVLGMVLARGVSANARDRQGGTVLLAAAGDYLRDSAASLDTNNPERPQPPILPGMLGYLLAHGADVNARDSWGRTALLIDAEAVDPRAVRLLLAHGADLNARDKYGRTALAWAAAKGQTDTAQALLDAGADPAARDVKGHTALDWARRGTFDGNGWGQRLGGRGHLLRLLQQHGLR